jgi:hypothetical protein
MEHKPLDELKAVADVAFAAGQAFPFSDDGA